MMNAGQKRKLQTWFAICLLVVCVTMPLLSHADQKTYEGSGWDMPEDAVLHYLDGLREQDIGKMISAYAVETYIDHFDLKAQLVRVGMHDIYMVPPMPNSGILLREINIESRKKQIVESILWQITSICLPGQDFSRNVALTSENGGEEVSVFVERIEKAIGALDFGTLKLMHFTPPEQVNELYASEGYQERIRAMIAPLGADELRGVIAFFIVDENFCVLACDAIRYGDRWFIHRFNGNIGALTGLDPIPSGVLAIPQGELTNRFEELDSRIQGIFGDLPSNLF